VVYVVDVYYITLYILAAMRTLQSSQGTCEAWHPRADYDLLLVRLARNKRFKYRAPTYVLCAAAAI